MKLILTEKDMGTLRGDQNSHSPQ